MIRPFFLNGVSTTDYSSNMALPPNWFVCWQRDFPVCAGYRQKDGRLFSLDAARIAKRIHHILEKALKTVKNRKDPQPALVRWKIESEKIEVQEEKERKVLRRYLPKVLAKEFMARFHTIHTYAHACTKPQTNTLQPAVSSVGAVVILPTVAQSAGRCSGNGRRFIVLQKKLSFEANPTTLFVSLARFWPSFLPGRLACIARFPSDRSLLHHKRA